MVEVNGRTGNAAKNSIIRCVYEWCYHFQFHTFCLFVAEAIVKCTSGVGE